MILNKFNNILEELSKAAEDVEKCELGNASAGRRTRKVCMEITRQLKELRAMILEHNKK